MKHSMEAKISLVIMLIFTGVNISGPLLYYDGHLTENFNVSIMDDSFAIWGCIISILIENLPQLIIQVCIFNIFLINLKIN